ncbi:hypothetical protein SCLCIDRAFT_1157419 [Scleroderma citrinum Foug A]|uniref:phosphoribosylglycinamide formyltransferase 1 n=1 Tax=Scleroderma citrinum Foug A TaxID=1036808 RepID=A0A0C3CYG2_9AGAM|nr:hypothetical protein SCLCIDRAFT_1157419 [Scleroderma citrinum Foug A]
MAILNSSDGSIPPQRIVVLISSSAAHRLIRATYPNLPIPTAYLGLQPFLFQNTRNRTRGNYYVEIVRIVSGARPDAIELAGGCIVFVVKLGVMVHCVVTEVDCSEPLIVHEVPIDRGKPIETYEQRLHQVEWEIIVQAMKRVLDELKLLPQEVVDENTE